MAVYPLNGTVIEIVQPKELHSNAKFDRVETQTKKRPEFFDDSGDNKLDSVHESKKMDSGNPILSHVSNSYKDYGTAVENFGYFSFPRSISSDPRYRGARLKYQKVLHTILEKAAFRKTTHSIGMIVIDIEIGQFCVTERKFVEMCNDGVKFKDDMVDKNIVRRAVHFFSRCGFVKHEVIHDKTLLTVTVPEFYTSEKTASEPTSEPEVNQKRTSKETHETQETINISYVADAPSEKKKSSSSSRKRKKVEPAPLVERDKGVFTSDIAHEKLIQEKGSEKLVKEIYSAMAVWKAQNGIEGGDDYRTAIKWSVTPKNAPRTYGKPVQPKYNHDTSPSLPSKSISFAEDV